MKLCVVPEEYVAGLEYVCRVHPSEQRRPPLPADIEAALELANELESGEPAHMGDALTLARALRNCNGRGE